MNLLKIFKSNDDKFYNLLEDAAENNVKAAKLLRELYANLKSPEKMAEKIHDLEHKGDEISHAIFIQINKSFVTPIDREDIVNITHALDDVIDFIYSAASDLDTYQIKKTTSYAKQFSTIILKSTEAINRALPKIRKRRTFHQVEKAIIEVNRLENEADKLIKVSLKSLFKDTKNPIDVIRFKSIYTTMEFAIDSCERIADVLGGLIIKYA